MSLQDFIEKLEQRDELHRIHTPIDPNLELATITNRICKAPDGGKALLFEKIKDSPFPVVTNLFGSKTRTALALGASSLTTFETRLGQELKNAQDANSAHKLRSVLDTPRLKPQQQGDNLPLSASGNLSDLPAFRFWPKETRTNLTLPLVMTIDPDTGQQNCGLYRIQCIDDKNASINFKPGSDGGQHAAAWARKKQLMPVVIVLGCAPDLIWAASAPLPSGCSEFDLVGWLRNAPLSVSARLHQALLVPADADIIIEGYITPNATAAETPFGNHSGGYVHNNSASLLNITSVRWKKNAICPATLVGPPPMENNYLAKASERFICALLRIDYPQIRDLHMPQETIFHGCTFITVEEMSERQRHDLIRSLWHSGPLCRAKLLILLHRDCNLRSPSEVYWRAINRLREDRMMVEGGKVALDATDIEPIQRLKEDPAITSKVAKRWAEYGFDPN
ncbi:MAG: menaquinone biosynthesis decarboxylase [Desulfuromonas sp.]|nr:MAG: menaquinone biosynthesis decarboxylase [Desulfuromonas sp.]